MKFKDGTKLGIRCKKYHGAGLCIFGFMFYGDKWDAYDFDTDDSNLVTECYFSIYLFRCEIHIGRIYE